MPERQADVAKTRKSADRVDRGALEGPPQAVGSRYSRRKGAAKHSALAVTASLWSCRPAPGAAESRRMDSSLCALSLSRPTRHQPGGQEREQQFVMSGNGKPFREIAFLPVGCGRGPLHNIHDRPVVLDKVKIRGS